MFYRVTPLSSGFMLTSIIGAIIAGKYVYPQDASYGFAFFLFFTLMFIASVVSMTLAPIEAELDVKRERNRKVKR